MGAVPIVQLSLNIITRGEQHPVVRHKSGEYVRKALPKLVSCDVRADQRAAFDKLCKLTGDLKSAARYIFRHTSAPVKDGALGLIFLVAPPLTAVAQRQKKKRRRHRGRCDVPAAFGEVAGRRIGEVWCEARGTEALPILVRWHFTSEKLWVQVHPNDMQAQQRGHAAGGQQPVNGPFFNL
jgi:hypothetical protein